MNMIVKTSDLVGFEAENQNKNKAAKAALSKLLASWESKQANKAKKIGGFGFLAVSLAACNNDSDNKLTDASGVTHASVDAAITSNDAAIAAAVDLTTDNAAAVTAALTDASGTSHATVDAAITSNDAAIAAAVDLTTDNAAATDASVAAQTSFTSLADLVSAYTALTAPVASTFTTAATDVFTGSASNDTFTGATANFQAADVLSDTSSTDNDTLNLTLTAALPTASITNIENINITWDAFGAATLDLTNIKGGSHVTLTSSKVGYLGGATVNNAGANTFTAGSGVNGTLDVNGGTAVTVNAPNGGTLTVDGSGTAANDTSATVVGGTTINVGAANAFIASTITGDANTTTITAASQNDQTITATGGNATTTMTLTNAGTITANGTAATTSVTAQARAASTTAANITVDASGLTTLVIDGTASTSDAATITSAASAVTADFGETTPVETVTFNAAAGSTITMNGNADVNTLVIASPGDVTLVAATEDFVNGATSTTVTDNAGNITVDFTHAAASVLTNLDVANLNLKASHASAITVKSGQVITADNSLAFDANATVTVAGAGTSDSVTFNVTGDKATDIATTAIETTNVNTTMNAGDANSINTLAGITAAGNVNVVANSALTITALELTTNNATVAAAGNLVITDFTAASVDATGTTGTSNITSNADADQVVVGGAGNNTVTMVPTTNNATYTGTAANDTLTINALTTGTGVANLGDGTNSVSATGLTSGTLVVTGGSGVDTVSTGAATNTGSITFTAGAGNDVFNLSDAAGANTVTFTGGAGDDTVKLITDLDGGTFTLNFGDGTGDILDMTTRDDNLSADTINATGLDIIKMDHATNDVLNASVLSGQTLTVQGDGGATDVLGVTATAASQSLDFSNITITQTLTAGLKGLAITTGNGTNSVTGSAGGDTVTGGTGVDTITSGAGADTVTGGTGNDVITLGEGADKVVLNGGTDAVTLTELTAAVDTVTVDIGAATLTGFDFGGTATDDNIEIDFSQINLATSVAGVKNGGTVVVTKSNGADEAGGAVAIMTLTGAKALANTGEEVIAINGNIADDSALETALEVGGTFQVSNPNAAIANNDVLLVLYDNGVNSYLATVEASGGIATNGTAAGGSLNAATFLTFTGVADCTSIVAADFAAII